MKSVQKTKVRIFSVWNKQLVNKSFIVRKVSEKCRKTDEISLEAQFCENQTKIRTKNLKNFWKIFGEFSLSYRQTSSKSYINKHSTVLIPHLSQIYLSKHTKI